MGKVSGTQSITGSWVTRTEDTKSFDICTHIFRLSMFVALG